MEYNPMEAFHNNAQIKLDYLNRVRLTRRSDGYPFGMGPQYEETDLLRCLFGSPTARPGPKEIGIPTEVIGAAEAIFDCQAMIALRKAHLAFPERFINTIALGSDLELVWPSLVLWLLREHDSPIPAEARHHAIAGAAVRQVSDLFASWIATGTKPHEERWSAAAASASEAKTAADRKLAEQRAVAKMALVPWSPSLKAELLLGKVYAACGTALCAATVRRTQDAGQVLRWAAKAGEHRSNPPRWVAEVGFHPRQQRTAWATLEDRLLRLVRNPPKLPRVEDRAALPST